MAITIKLMTNTPELQGPALGVLKTSAGFVRQDHRNPIDVMVGAISATALLTACNTVTNLGVELLLLEARDTSPLSLHIHMATASQLGRGSYHGRYFKCRSGMVGSLYGFQRTYIAWGTDRGLGFLRDIPDARPVHKQTGRHKVGATEHKEAHDGLAGISGGEYAGYLNALKRWEHITRSPMPRIGNEHGELRGEWLGWSMGHGNKKLGLGRRIGLRSIPHMAFFGWSRLAGIEGTWETPALF